MIFQIQEQLPDGYGMKRSLAKKIMKKTYPPKVCEKVVIGEEEKCVDMIKLKKEIAKEKHCSFHPKTVCKKTDGMECKRVAKKMCDYTEYH